MRTFVVIMFGVTLIMSAVANWANTATLDITQPPSAQALVLDRAGTM